jgi:CO/xanthine dehydrogenase Mo-binding subunit
MAAEQVRERLTEMAVRVTGMPADQLVLEDGTVGGLSYQEVIIHEFGAHAGSLVGAGTFTPAYEKPDRQTGQSSKITAFWMVGGSGVDITVDIETGKITVDRIVTVGDVGRALNPQMVRRQLTGGAVMQLGQTMTEEMRYDGGQLTNTGLAFYKVPTILDVPVANEAVIVEAEHRNGPFGAKGVGETGTFALSPAIANAVHDAVGVRIRQLPITGERVLAALRERQD